MRGWRITAGGWVVLAVLAALVVAAALGSFLAQIGAAVLALMVLANGMGGRGYARKREVLLRNAPHLPYSGPETTLRDDGDDPWERERERRAAKRD